ncbi:MAG: UxaA family hydrolase [Pseudomonadota bacterium]
MRDPRLIRLAPEDAVLVVGASLAAGETLALDEGETALPAPLTLGHKIAARDIAAGERVLKYGMPIGVATRDIARGEHVHVHNMRSDWTPTFTLEDA